MKTERIGFGVATLYLWVMMILLGAIILETFMVYPNIFRDPPASLESALEFMSVRGPSDFFPPLGFLSWVAGLGSVLLAWRVREARYWILFSLLMVGLEGLSSVVYFWPRNEIMFLEGLDVHSADFLRQTAEEFESLHWLRLAFNALAAVSLFVGYLKYHRHLVTRDTEPTDLAVPDVG